MENYWEYIAIKGNPFIPPMDTTYFSITVEKDTLINNRNYKKVVKRRIPANAIQKISFERVDSSAGIAYQFIEGKEKIIENFNVSVSEFYYSQLLKLKLPWYISADSNGVKVKSKFSDWNLGKGKDYYVMPPAISFYDEYALYEKVGFFRFKTNTGGMAPYRFNLYLIYANVNGFV